MQAGGYGGAHPRGEQVVRKNTSETNVAVPISAIYPRLAAALSAEEGYILKQTEKPWHFADEIPALAAVLNIK